MTHRPRIAVVSPNFPNSADPYLAIYNYHAARALQRWADVAVYCVMPSYPRYLFHPRTRAYRRVDGDFSMPEVQVRYIHYPALQVLTRFLNGRTAARYLRPQLRDAPPDLILAYGIYPGGEGAVRVGEAFGVPSDCPGAGVRPAPHCRPVYGTRRPQLTLLSRPRSSSRSAMICVSGRSLSALPTGSGRLERLRRLGVPARRSSGNALGAWRAGGRTLGRLRWPLGPGQEHRRAPRSCRPPRPLAPEAFRSCASASGCSKRSFARVRDAAISLPTFASWASAAPPRWLAGWLPPTSCAFPPTRKGARTSSWRPSLVEDPWWHRR